MASRHVRARSRAPSSCSISSSSSESPPSSVPAFDFTLYGSPAPRSAHRTSSGASKPKPRRRSTKPMPAPPASPQITHCTEEFQLDFSFLAADDEELIVTNNASEICYREHDIVFKELSNQSREATKQNQVEKIDNFDSNKNFCSEAIETDDLESAGKTIRLFDSDRDSEDELHSENRSSSTNVNSSTMESLYSEGGRISSEFISSNQSFGDEGSSSTGSCLSGRSSCVTLSEYSVDSSSSTSSLKSRMSHQREIYSCSNSSRETDGDLSNKIREKKNKVEHRSVELAVESSVKGNGTHQIKRSLPEENLSRKSENSRQLKASNQKLSGCFTNSNMVTELHVAPSCGSKKNACASDSFSVCIECRSEETHNLITSSNCKNSKNISTQSIELLTGQGVQVNEKKCELNNTISYTNFENKCMTSEKTSVNVDIDNTKSKSFTIFGHHFLNKVNEIQIKERTIEEERKAEHQCLCSEAGNTKTYTCPSNTFLLVESDTRPSYNSDFCDTNARCSGRKNHFDEKPGEYVAGVDIISQNECSATGKSKPGSSGLKSPPPAGNYVSPTSLRNDEDDDDKSYSCNEECQVLHRNYQMSKQELYSPPIRSHTPNTVEGLSVMACDSESGRTSRRLLECLDCRYFPDISFPVEEVMEAVICARQLVCVLERALDRNLPSNTKESNTDSSVGKSSSSFPTNSTRRKQRSNSLSPNVLRRCKESNSACSSAMIGFSLAEKHSVRDNDSVTGKMEGVNHKEICDGVGRRGVSCVDAPPLLIVSAEELRKQRTLLKPVANRGVHRSVAQVVDMADVLRSTISRRRKFLDPSDEFMCGNDRSDSECSLENV